MSEVQVSDYALLFFIDGRQKSKLSISRVFLNRLEILFYIRLFLLFCLDFLVNFTFSSEQLQPGVRNCLLKAMLL